MDTQIFPTPTPEKVAAVYEKTTLGFVKDEIIEKLGFDSSSTPTPEEILNAAKSCDPHILSDLSTMIALEDNALSQENKDKELAKEMDDAEDNFIDYVQNFRRDYRRVSFTLKENKINNYWRWDPANVGVELGVNMVVDFKGHYIHISCYPEDSLNSLLKRVFKIEPTPNNLLKAMNTNDWFLHFEYNNKYKEVRFYFHNTLTEYNYSYVSEVYNFLLEGYERYIENLKKTFRIPDKSSDDQLIDEE